MTTVVSMVAPRQTKPILLFNDECSICRRIARWVSRSAQLPQHETSMIVQAIGDDPAALRLLHANLDIWDAYATIHLLMPDGAMKVGGEAVAEVLRNLENTKWFSWTFAVSIFGFRPFQMMLNLGYAVLADLRPLLGCESCGTPGFWVKSIRWIATLFKAHFGGGRHPRPRPHFTSRVRPVGGRQPISTTGADRILRRR